MPVVNLGPDQCFSSPTTLNAGNTGLLYQWNTGDITQSVLATTTGNYSVTVTSYLSKDCFGTDDIEIKIIPDPIFNMTDSRICSHEKLTIPGITNLHLEHTVKWSPGGSIQIPLVLQDLTAGTYYYTLEVEGCTMHDQTVKIEVINCELHIPNVFTPNGDGVNDRFEITNLEYFKNSRMSIYNRWGLKVYESTDYASEWWDGANHSDGVYYYVLHVTEGLEQQYQGSVTLLRSR